MLTIPITIPISEKQAVVKALEKGINYHSTSYNLNIEGSNAIKQYQEEYIKNKFYNINDYNSDDNIRKKITPEAIKEYNDDLARDMDLLKDALENGNQTSLKLKLLYKNILRGYESQGVSFDPNAKKENKKTYVFVLSSTPGTNDKERFKQFLSNCNPEQVSNLVLREASKIWQKGVVQTSLPKIWEAQKDKNGEPSYASSLKVKAGGLIGELQGLEKENKAPKDSSTRIAFARNRLMGVAVKEALVELSIGRSNILADTDMAPSSEDCAKNARAYNELRGIKDARAKIIFITAFRSETYSLGKNKHSQADQTIQSMNDPKAQPTLIDKFANRAIIVDGKRLGNENNVVTILASKGSRTDMIKPSFLGNEKEDFKSAYKNIIHEEQSCFSSMVKLTIGVLNRSI